MSLGAYSDSFYEYLLKVWLITNKEDTDSRDMFYEAIDVCRERERERISEKETSEGREGLYLLHVVVLLYRLWILGCLSLSLKRSFL